MKTKIAYRFNNKEELKQLVELYGRSRFCYIPNQSDLKQSFEEEDEEEYDIQGYLFDAITCPEYIGSWTSGVLDDEFVFIELPEKCVDCDGIVVYKDRVKFDLSVEFITIKELENLIEISKNL